MGRDKRPGAETAPLPRTDVPCRARKPHPYYEPSAPETLADRLCMPGDEIVRLADEHTIAVQAWLSTRARHAVRFDGLGVTAGSSGYMVTLLNLALGGNYPPGTSDTLIGSEIEAVKAFFADRGVPWYWWLGPHPRPSDMGERLERHGLAFDRPSLPAMVALLPARCPPLNPDAQVWRATSRTDLAAASTIRRTAFRFPEDAALDYFEAMAGDWLRGNPARLYLVRLPGGPPAAIGALILGAGVPGVYVMATLPEWRRRGLGKAILARILSDAAADGHHLIVLTASRFGYPLYRQFGFEHVFDYAIHRPAKPHVQVMHAEPET
jgi:GNAT superfamily N-acetyltransferase